MLTQPEEFEVVIERVDLPRKVVQDQIALAINEEVLALEAAGIKVIQVDEPALREGLPLLPIYHEQYLKDAVLSFKLATSSVRDELNPYTYVLFSIRSNHSCYS